MREHPRPPHGTYTRKREGLSQLWGGEPREIPSVRVLRGSSSRTTPRRRRGLVTVVFCDLAGSTSMGETLDSESLRAVMTRYFEEMRSVLEITAASSRSTSGRGDGGLRAPGRARGRRDSRCRGGRNAAALERLNDELEDFWGVRLTSRIGVNTGEVVSGDPTEGEHLVVGDAVNVAARLEQAAGGMEILIGPLTYRLAREAIEVEPVEPLELKGKAERSLHTGSWASPSPMRPLNEAPPRSWAGSVSCAFSSGSTCWPPPRALPAGDGPR